MAHRHWRVRRSRLSSVGTSRISPCACVIGKPSKPETQRRWRISLILERAELLGFVDAPDAATAIKEAIERFSVEDEERQKRLVAVRWN